MSKRVSVPVIMYHSIGVVDRKWHWDYLTCPYQLFESHLKWMKRLGYYTLNYQEIYDYVIHEKPVPKRSVFLTFDDGYLDNYVYAYPLLKKYNMKGTVFVNPDFVEATGELRKTYNSFNEEPQLESNGFCNWNELKKIDSEGVLDVQSHAKTHTWYPISDRIIDFRHPGDSYVWMDWNERPDKKPFLQFIDWNNAKLGMPIFEHEKALSSKRVFINENFENELHKYVLQNGNSDFFLKDTWKEELNSFSEELRNKYSVISSAETKTDYLERIRFELDYTKKKIEDKLDKKVNFLCWPGGSATKEGVAIAKDLGYLMSTVARDLSKEEKDKIINSPDYPIDRIIRFAPTIYSETDKKSQKLKVKYSSGWYFVLELLSFRNANFEIYFMRYFRFVFNKLNKIYGK